MLRPARMQPVADLLSRIAAAAPLRPAFSIFPTRYLSTASASACRLTFLQDTIPEYYQEIKLPIAFSTIEVCRSAALSRYFRMFSSRCLRTLRAWTMGFCCAALQ